MAKVANASPEKAVIVCVVSRPALPTVNSALMALFSLGNSVMTSLSHSPDESIQGQELPAFRLN